jgi:hypothetical protein
MGSRRRIFLRIFSLSIPHLAKLSRRRYGGCLRFEMLISYDISLVVGRWWSFCGWWSGVLAIPDFIKRI